MALEDIYQKYLSCNAVCTDTRKIRNNDIFFALKGESFDGNSFAEEALKLGAAYCVIDNAEIAHKNPKFILVRDVLTTLQELALFHRRQIKIPIISLTGSNGKTTTKELIFAVLSTKFKVKATEGNLNNHIGVPLTLLSFPKDLDFGIVEMGANHQKEIEFLSQITEPDYGVITNFGKAHLEGFGGVEGVIKGKSELYDFLKANHKTVFINTDDQKQLTQIGKYDNITTFGALVSNDCVLSLKDADPYVHVSYDGLVIKSSLIGDYNFGNIAIAIAIGQYFNISSEQIRLAIESYKPKNNRSEMISKNTNRIVLDAYNANPTSMLAALKNFKLLHAENKCLFLGDMFELGDSAKLEHQHIVDYVESHFEDNIYLAGENFYNTKTGSKSKKFRDFEALKLAVEGLKFKDTSILIKGSRGMALERLLESL